MPNFHLQEKKQLKKKKSSNWHVVFAPYRSWSFSLSQLHNFKEPAPSPVMAQLVSYTWANPVSDLLEQSSN